MSLYDALLILKGIGEQTLNRLQMNNIYNGNLLAMMVNLVPRKNRRTYKWTDFYRDVSVQKPKEIHEMTNEEISAKLHMMFGSVTDAA